MTPELGPQYLTRGPSLTQVGSIGDDEDWKVLYEKENEPDAQVLEIPNLAPFTQYRSVLATYFTCYCYDRLFSADRGWVHKSHSTVLIVHSVEVGFGYIYHTVLC